MKPIQLPLPLQFRPQNPAFINFPIKSNAELARIRADASSKFGRARRPSPTIEIYRAACLNELN